MTCPRHAGPRGCRAARTASRGLLRARDAVRPSGAHDRQGRRAHDVLLEQPPRREVAGVVGHDDRLHAELAREQRRRTAAPRRRRRSARRRADPRPPRCSPRGSRRPCSPPRRACTPCAACSSVEAELARRGPRAPPRARSTSSVEAAGERRAREHAERDRRVGDRRLGRRRARSSRARDRRPRCAGRRCSSPPRRRRRSSRRRRRPSGRRPTASAAACPTTSPSYLHVRPPVDEQAGVEARAADVGRDRQRRARAARASSAAPPAPGDRAGHDRLERPRARPRRRPSRRRPSAS